MTWSGNGAEWVRCFFTYMGKALRDDVYMCGIEVGLPHTMERTHVIV